MTETETEKVRQILETKDPREYYQVVLDQTYRGSLGNAIQRDLTRPTLIDWQDPAINESWRTKELVMLGVSTGGEECVDVKTRLSDRNDTQASVSNIIMKTAIYTWTAKMFKPLKINIR